MKRFILCLFLICLTPITGQEQTSDIVKAPTGETLFRWFGHAGRSYFLQQTDPYDPLQSWYWMAWPIDTASH